MDRTLNTGRLTCEKWQYTQQRPPAPQVRGCASHLSREAGRPYLCEENHPLRQNGTSCFCGRVSVCQITLHPRTSQVLYGLVQHQVQELIVPLQDSFHCERHISNSVRPRWRVTPQTRQARAGGPPSRPPASFTRTPLSTNLARSKADSLRDMPRRYMPAAALAAPPQAGRLRAARQGPREVGERVDSGRLAAAEAAPALPAGQPCRSTSLPLRYSYIHAQTDTPGVCIKHVCPMAGIGDRHDYCD